MTALTKAELARLKECETVIERNVQGVIELGNALKEIKETKLWEQGYESFDAYCEQRWHFGKRYANYVVSSATIIEEMGTRVPASIPLPIQEAQTRALVNLPTPEAKAKAWTAAVESAGGVQPTAAQVKAAVAEMGTRVPEKKPKQHAILNPDIDADMEHPDDTKREPGEDDVEILPRPAGKLTEAEKAIDRIHSQLMRAVDTRAREDFKRQGPHHKKLMDLLKQFGEAFKNWHLEGTP